MLGIKIKIGDFIAVPAWKTFGLVLDTAHPDTGSDQAQKVLLQEYPEQPLNRCMYYTLEPGQFEPAGD